MAETPGVVQKASEFNLWLIRKVGSIPKSYRFSIGDRLIDGVIAMLVPLGDAKLNQFRFLLRLANDLKLLTVDSYGYAAGNVEEIGRMVGGG